MNPFLKIKQFASREDGSLLVFFLISVVTILGIVALSFDLGRRASTQTDMQSFADNVALAAAGELDGQPDAIARATYAANNAIAAANEALKGGVAGTNATLSIETLVFYSDLPATDRPGSFDVADLSDPTSASYKYWLPTANTTTSDVNATYVGVRLNRIDPQWIFGKVFEGGNAYSNLDPGATPGTPNAADHRRSISAVAIAGNSAWTCEVSPLMFCLPRRPIDPANPTGPTESVFPQPGDGVRLQSVGQNSAWNPGQFGFLDINWLQANAASGPCIGETPESRFQACLLARGISACFNSRRVDVQTGQRAGQEGAAFNLPFGFVGAAMNNLANGQNAAFYATGPHTISGIEANGGCNNLSASPDTMPFPLDDCHATNSCPDGRFGDGDWSTGRTTYVDTNYTLRDSGGTVIEPGSFFDLPGTNLTRYEYYLQEIARAANSGVGPGGHNPTSTASGTARDWDSYWPAPPTNGFNPIIPPGHNREDNGLHQCNLPASSNADRRVIIAAGIDCPPGLYSGTVPGDVPVAQYFRVFQLAPARDVPGSGTGNSDPIYQIDVEIIEAVGGEAGASTVDAGIFREVIQLYK